MMKDNGEQAMKDSGQRDCKAERVSYDSTLAEFQNEYATYDMPRWMERHSTSKHTCGEIADAEDGTSVYRLTKAVNLQDWERVVGSMTYTDGGTFSYRIITSRNNFGDCLLAGAVDATANAKTARVAKAVVYSPRSGETYVFGRNSEGSYGIRRVLFGWPCLFGEAEGAAINVTVLAGGEVAIAVNGGEAKPTGVTFANGVRPFAQLGRQGDAVALLANL